LIETNRALDNLWAVVTAGIEGIWMAANECSLSSLNLSTHQDRLKTIPCEGARASDTKDPTTMPKTKKLRDEVTYRLLPPVDAQTWAGRKSKIAITSRSPWDNSDEEGLGESSRRCSL
jgi:hypothetical protein